MSSKSISDLKIKRITVMDDLAVAGVCGPTLTGKSGYAFVPADAEVQKMIKDAGSLGHAKFIWAFKYKAKESALSVYGVVLCTSRQAVVTAKIRSALN